MGDTAVAEGDEVVDDLAYALALRRTDAVRAAARHVRAHHDQGGAAPRQFAEEGGVRFGPEQDQRLAAVAEQRLGGRALVAPRGAGRQQHVVLQALRLRVDRLDQVGVEGMVQGQQHADGAAAAAGQQPGGAVRLVAQLVGCPQDALPGLLAGARPVTEDQGDQGARDTRPGGHIHHGGALLVGSCQRFAPVLSHSGRRPDGAVLRVCSRAGTHFLGRPPPALLTSRRYGIMVLASSAL